MNGSVAVTGSGYVPAVRRFMRRVPGLKWLAECVRTSPGSWLYRRPTSDWLSDAALVSQLPRSYRWFARYCSAQRGNPVGAELLLRLIIRVRSAMRAAPAIRLEIRGEPVFVNLNDPRFLVIPWELTRGLPRILKKFLGPGDTFIDVGANHGTFAITAAQLVGSTGLVIAIEPQARLADAVRRSLELYGAPFAVYNAACGESSGTAKLYVPRASSGSGGLHPSFSAVSRHETATVRLIRLDDLLEPHRLPGRVFVKLDVEGSEASCVAGARDFLASARPAILMEINARALQAAGSSKASLIAALRESGYDRYLGGGELDRESAMTDWVADFNGDQVTHFNIVALHRSQTGF